MLKPPSKTSVARVATVPFFIVTHLRRQIEDLCAAGIEVTTVSSPGPELDGMRWNGSVRHRTVDISRRIDPWSDLVALWKLYRLFRRERFDVVHSNTPKAGLLSSLAGWMARVPVRLHTFTGQPWVTLRGPAYHAARLADKVIGRLATRCYADSHGQRAFLIREGIIPEGRIDVIGSGSISGVDLARFDPNRFSPEERDRLRTELGIPSTSRIVLFVGRICEDKGIRELLAAFDRLRTEQRDVALLLVGPFDARQTTVSPQEVLDRPAVYHVGFTHEPERYMTVADVLALPSYREGFPSVIMEAAAMGVPCVGTDIYGISDAIVDGRTGVLVQVRDVDTLASALARLLDDRATLRAMGTAGRERCVRDFDAAVVSRRVISEYRRFLEAR